MALTPAVALVVAVACGGGLAGCADASARFREFEERRAAFDSSAFADPAAEGGAGGGGPRCQPPAPGSVHGPALLALETSSRPGAAILFFGQLSTPSYQGTTGVEYAYQALAITDRRTLVGEALVVGPYAIEPDGSFDAPTAESTLPGSGNAILPGVPITSQLTLHGAICGVSDFYCGTVTGSVSAPIDGMISGQFGLRLLPSLDEMPARPRFGCAEDALAEPLE